MFLISSWLLSEQKVKKHNSQGGYRDSQIVGFPYNQDPSRMPLTSETITCEESKTPTTAAPNLPLEPDDGVEVAAVREGQATQIFLNRGFRV